MDENLKMLKQHKKQRLLRHVKHRLENLQGNQARYYRGIIAKLILIPIITNFRERKPWEGDSDEEEKPVYSRDYFSNSDMDSEFDDQCKCFIIKRN